MTEQRPRTEDLTSWRVQDLVSRAENADPGDFIFYHLERCTGCGQCALVCAAGLWSVPPGGKAKLAPRYRELCLECAACYAVCEKDAIDFIYPEGGAGIVIRYG